MLQHAKTMRIGWFREPFPTSKISRIKDLGPIVGIKIWKISIIVFEDFNYFEIKQRGAVTN